MQKENGETCCREKGKYCKMKRKGAGVEGISELSGIKIFFNGGQGGEHHQDGGPFAHHAAPPFAADDTAGRRIGAGAVSPVQTQHCADRGWHAVKTKGTGADFLGGQSPAGAFPSEADVGRRSGNRLRGDKEYAVFGRTD